MLLFRKAFLKKKKKKHRPFDFWTNIHQNSLFHWIKVKNNLAEFKSQLMFLFFLYPKEINRQDKSGKTPLHTAILSKQFHIVDKLLESGADVTINDDAGDTPLHTAIHVGSDKLVLVSTPMYFRAPWASLQICSGTVILVVRLEFKPLFVVIPGLFTFTHYFIYCFVSQGTSSSWGM